MCISRIKKEGPIICWPECYTTFDPKSQTQDPRLAIRHPRGAHANAPARGDEGRISGALPRFLSSTLLPFLAQGPLIETEYEEKGCPYYKGATQEPS